MYVLGISCYYHDAAACLLKDGIVVAAASEERFTRKKHDSDYPKNAIEFCMKQADIMPSDLDYICFYDKPLLKLERLAENYLSFSPRGILSFLTAMPVQLGSKLWIKSMIKKELNTEKSVLFVEHHQSHAASAFFQSPFKTAAILTADGVGEWATTTLGKGDGDRIEMLKEIRYPHSLGLLYSAFTYYLGFKVNSAEYKVMGLAPYGKPEYYDVIMDELVDVKEDGSFRLNLRYFEYMHGLKMTNKRFSRLFGAVSRKPEEKLTQRHFDVARSIQMVTEEIMLKMAAHLKDETGERNLCLAGGVALNCVANGRLLRELGYHDIYIQPASGDDGGALGAAKFVHHQLLRKRRRISGSEVPYYGPAFSDAKIEEALKARNARYSRYTSKDLAKAVANILAGQKVVGWFQGRMEFGPRALGNRSILADPRDPKMRDIVNLKIKFRESFRPFAPAVLEEYGSEVFELDRPSLHMLLVAQVRKGWRTIPAVTHVDGSARVQTVTRAHNPLFYSVIEEFYRMSGVPLILNTSFNERGEPIVCTPDDAFLCFMRTNIDYLAVGNFLLDKKRQKHLGTLDDWRNRKQFEND